MGLAATVADGIGDKVGKTTVTRGIGTDARRMAWKWKNAYRDVIDSPEGPDGKLRGALCALIKMTDHKGRTWHSQASIAHFAGLTERTLRRYLDELESQGWILSRKMTWAEIAVEQQALRLPPPRRDDPAQSPNLIVLAHNHRAAEEQFIFRVAGGQNAHPPRPIDAAQALDNLADDLLGSVIDNFNQEEGDPPKSSPRIIFNEVKNEKETRGWEALCNAYQAHYKRVYHARPTAKVADDLAVDLGGHVADIAEHLQARLSERGVAITLDASLERIADIAMRNWLNHTGNGYLRRVGHNMSALRLDLPKRARDALSEALQELTPTPPPRMCAVAPSSQEIREIVPNSVHNDQPACAANDVVVPEKPISTRQDAPEKPISARQDATVVTFSPRKMPKRGALPNWAGALPNSAGALPNTNLYANKPRMAPDIVPPEAEKLLELLGKPVWCDQQLASLLVEGKTAEDVLRLFSGLRLDEKSMTRQRIVAMLFQAEHRA